MTATRLRGSSRVLCLTAAMVASLFVATGPAREAAAQVAFGANLITNPGADEGGAAPTGYEVVPVPGWTTTGEFTVVSYATGGGFPTAADPGPPDRGPNFFAGGPSGQSNSASQVIDVSSAAASLDAGGVTYALTGYLGGFLLQEDNAVVTATFMSASAAVLGTATIGPVTAADRNGQTGLLPRETGGTVPAGTRSIRVTITATRLEGQYNDGYTDSLALSLGGDAGQCTVTWDGGAGTTSWHDAANWDNNAVPGPGDDVCLLGPATSTVTHSTGTTQIASLLARQGFTLSGGTLELQSTLRTSSATPCCSFTLSGGVLAGRGTLEVANFTWSGGEMRGPGTTVVVDADGIVDPGTPCCEFTGATKTLSSGRTLRIADAVAWSSGDIEMGGGAAITNAGHVRVTGAVSLAGIADANEPCCPFTNNGTLEMNASARVFGGTPCCTFTNNGTLRVTAGTVDLRGAFTNFDAATRTLTGGTFVVTGTLSFTDAALSSLSADVTLRGEQARITDHLGNDALGFLDGAEPCCELKLVDGFDLTTNDDFANSGDVSIGADSVFTAGGAYTQDQGTTILVDPSSLLTTGDPCCTAVGIDGGTLSGVGTVAAPLFNAATVAPGLSPGTLSVDGDYDQAGSGALKIELTKRKSDRLAVSGNADLGGSLVVKGVKRLKIGKKFTILTADRRTGKFKRVRVRGIGSNRKLSIRYKAAAVVLVVARK